MNVMNSNDYYFLFQKIIIIIFAQRKPDVKNFFLSNWNHGFISLKTSQKSLKNELSVDNFLIIIRKKLNMLFVLRMIKFEIINCTVLIGRTVR